MKLPRLCRFLARRLVPPRRDPDFLIGGREHPYMKRWWLIPRNRLCNVYLHNMLRSDDDRALHDHPWWSLSFCLKGGLTELTFADAGAPARLAADGEVADEEEIYRARDISAGDVVWRSASFAHRLVVDDLEECWTLFITGPVIRRWGFHCPKGWRHWKDFVAPSDSGDIGRGCE